MSTCQEERSQHKNKDKAMRLLAAKIIEEKRRKAHHEMRRSALPKSDREIALSGSAPIISLKTASPTIASILTLYKLNLIMEGDLDEITEALVAYFHQEKLLAQHEDVER